MASSAAIWLASGLTEPLPYDIAVLLLLGSCAFALAHEFGVVRLRLPENRRLIPQDLFFEHSGRAISQFGFELGTGVRTYVPTTSPYILANTILLLSPPLMTALIIGVGFGLGRAAVLLAWYLSREAHRWDLRLSEREPILTKAVSPLTTLGIIFLVLA